MDLQSSDLQISVLPDVGGKIAQILDKRSATKLLVEPQQAYQQIPLGAEWIKYDTSGMDDCFPNVAPGHYSFAPWPDLKLPQLGEWVYGRWDVCESEANLIELRKSGNLLPYIATKAISLPTSRTVRIDYAVENRSPFPLRFIWSAHPLFNIEEFFKLQLPPGNTCFSIFPFDGERYYWPSFKGKDLSREWIEPGKTLKIFLSGLAEGWCKLTTDANEVRLSFDLGQTPYLGLWFNNFGLGQFQRYFRCVAVEPCTAPTDLLDQLRMDASPSIPPWAVNRWWLEIKVS